MQISQLGSVDQSTSPNLQKSSAGNGAPLGGSSTQPIETPAPTPVPARHTDSQVKGAVDVTNQFMKTLSVNLTFSVDKDSGLTVVKVVDSTTKEVVKQMPSEEVVDLARALNRLQGLLLKTQA